MARTGVARGRQYTPNVDFALEDTTRTEHDFILEVVDAVMKEGVRFVALCDTVGFALPWEFGELVEEVRARVPRRAHLRPLPRRPRPRRRQRPHRASTKGAERVDTCFNGLGERAGNAATEDVVMAIRTRRSDLDLDVKVDTTKIIPTSRLIARLSGMQPQWTKSVVGANAFAHGGGIHQDGVLKDTRTYEIMRPEDIGLPPSERRMYVGKLSGRAALNAQLKELGYELDAGPARPRLPARQARARQEESAGGDGSAPLRRDSHISYGRRRSAGAGGGFRRKWTRVTSYRDAVHA